MSSNNVTLLADSSTHVLTNLPTCLEQSSLGYKSCLFGNCNETSAKCACDLNFGPDQWFYRNDNCFIHEDFYLYFTIQYICLGLLSVAFLLYYSRKRFNYRPQNYVSFFFIIIINQGELTIFLL